MTRKDFIKIAETIRLIDLYSNSEEGKHLITVDTVINTFAEMLEADNQSFDRDKFIKYILK